MATEVSDDLLLTLLTNHIKIKLSESLLETAKKEIDVVVEQAVKELNINVASSKDYFLNHMTVKFILEDKRNG